MNTEETIALLREELDPETVSELIEQFFTDTPVQIAAMRDAAQRHELATLGRLAHSLAGSSSTFGLESFQAVARALEDVALAGDAAQIPERLEAVAAASEAGLAELRRFRKP